MKIAMVCPRGVPHVVGGAERLWAGVVAAINEQTPHVATLVEVASPESSLREVLHSYARFDGLDLDEFDLVISGKYPAWMVRHRRHVVHMCHPLRGLYDMYPSEWPLSPSAESSVGQGLLTTLRRCRSGSDDNRSAVLAAARDMVDTLDDGHPDLAFPGPLARQLVHWLDADALHPKRIARYTAISRVVAERPDYFPPTVHVDVLIPPSGLVGLHEGEFNNFFTASRLDQPKRIDLLIRAFLGVAGPYFLRIAGVGPMEQQLKSLAAGDPRISFLGWISDEQLVEEYAAALAVPFIPYHEDLGLITLEAQMSAKPVITCVDSGGTADLVEHGVDGFVVDPTVESLTEAMKTFTTQPQLAEKLGRRGRLRAAEIDWANIVRGLLGEQRQAQKPTRRQRLVALSTYPASPARHGGQVRINRLYHSLAERFDVHLVALGDGHGKSGRIGPGLWQTVIDPPSSYHELNGLLSTELGVPTGDIVATLSADTMDQFKAVVQVAAEDAAAILLCQPYLYPFLQSLDARIPVIYDSQNAEWSLKRDMYPSSDVGQSLATAVAEVEAAVIARSSLVTVVSAEDRHSLRDLQSSLADFALVPNGSDVVATPFVTGEERRLCREDYLSYIHQAGLAPHTDSVVVFLGSAHPPNIAAAGQVLAVAEQMPNTLFVLLGTHVAELGGMPTGANVVCRGVVDQAEITVLLSLCDVALNPMLSGSGTNIKMIDYFAAGAPTVSSAIGARGLDVEHDRHLLIAESLEDLKKSIGQVLADPSSADLRAAAARQAAIPFDWLNAGRAFTEEIQRALST